MDKPSPQPSVPWRSRGYLPHFDRPGLWQSVTFRLADSLPQSVLQTLEDELRELPDQERSWQQREKIAEWLDRGLGQCYLRDPQIAASVEQAFLYFDDKRYRLLAWCIMPNHVHVIIESRGFELAKIVHSWKSYTARFANQYLGRRGPFWQREYFDRFIRNEAHFLNAVTYVESNAVSAGLVSEASKWRWCSAWEGWGDRQSLPWS